LVDNWAFLFNSGPRFHGIWLLEIIKYLEGLSEFFLRWYFFFNFYPFFLGFFFVFFMVCLLLSCPRIIHFNLTPCNFFNLWIIYQIINVFKFHPCLNLSNLVPIMLIAMYFIYYLFCFQISSFFVSFSC
jgi:hypothetical protein